LQTDQIEVGADGALPVVVQKARLAAVALVSTKLLGKNQEKGSQKDCTTEPHTNEVSRLRADAISLGRAPKQHTINESSESCAARGAFGKRRIC
jgi:hypothetical protein